MTNRSSSKQHCFVGKKFPKAKKGKKRNKYLARLRREEAASTEVKAAKAKKAPAKKKVEKVAA